MIILTSARLARFAGLTVTTALFLSTAIAPAQAQLDAQTGIADPSRAAQEFERQQVAPQVAPQVDVRAAQPIGAPAGADKITFKLERLDITGATVYSGAALEALYAGQVGNTISLADVYAIANELMLQYREDGFVLTQVVVPPQTIDGGVAKIQVVEGYIDQIQVQNVNESASIDMNNIQSYANQISTGGPLNLRDLERELLIINDLPGVSARSVLSPSANKVGAADLTILVDYDPFDGQVSIDNFGSRYLGPVQVGAAGTMNSFLGLNEAITVQTVMAPEDWYELAFGSLSYEQPIGPYGTKLRLTGSVTDTEPGYDLERFDVRGQSQYLGIQASHPFIRSRSENLAGRLILDWRKVKSSNNIEDTRKDRISAVRAGMKYDFIDRLLGVGANTMDVELSQGLNILGASEEGDGRLSRALADPQFTKIEAELQRLQRVTSAVNILLAARGQLANDALLSSEEFSVGGIGYGRGYEPSEVVGDEGIAGKIELQWKEPVRLDQTYVDSYQLYSFYDIGRVWNDDATTSSQKRNSIASVGVGARFDLPMDMEAGLAVALPMTREVSTQNDKDPKVYFNFSKRF